MNRQFFKLIVLGLALFVESSFIFIGGAALAESSLREGKTLICEQVENGLEVCLEIQETSRNRTIASVPITLSSEVGDAGKD